MKRTDTTNLTSEELRDLVRELEDQLEEAEDRIADTEEERDAAEVRQQEAEDEAEDTMLEWTEAAREAAEAIKEFAREQIAEIPRTPDALARLDWNRMTGRIAKAFGMLDSTSADTIYGAASLY